jgi:integrase
MGSIFPRGSKLYAKTKAVDGTWKQIPTGLSVGAEAEAEKWLADLERKVEAQRAAMGDDAAPVTVSRYAKRWLDRRTTTTVADDRARITKHVLPRIGPMLLAEVRPRHIRDIVIELRNAGELAPATIRQVSGVLHTMFKSAVIEELIASNPVVLERGTLPKKVDKDPTWRHEAIYTRLEIETLIADERILADRRVLYALKSLAALRHTEAATLTWAQYDHRAEPLGAFNLGETKNGVPRRMPVHATLARMLVAWKATGWREVYGRDPKPDDLIVPTRNLTARDANESQRQLIADLELLELRVTAGKGTTTRRQKRRGHDMRRTFITLARTDGAQKDILRWCTHGPSPGEMMDLYSSFDWSALCAEVAKLRIEPRDGKVISMPLRIAANGGAPTHPNAEFGAGLVQFAKGRERAGKKERPRRDSNPCYLRERRVS